MKAIDKKRIVKLNEEIEALKAREVEMEKHWDDLWEIGERDAYRKAVDELSAEYEGIDAEIGKRRDEIRRIRDNDLIARGYGHSLALARANID